MGMTPSLDRRAFLGTAAALLMPKVDAEAQQPQPQRATRTLSGEFKMDGGKSVVAIVTDATPDKLKQNAAQVAKGGINYTVRFPVSGGKSLDDITWTGKVTEADLAASVKTMSELPKGRHMLDFGIGGGFGKSSEKGSIENLEQNARQCVRAAAAAGMEGIRFVLKPSNLTIPDAQPHLKANAKPEDRMTLREHQDQVRLIMTKLIAAMQDETAKLQDKYPGRKLKIMLTEGPADAFPGNEAQATAHSVGSCMRDYFRHMMAAADKNVTSFHYAYGGANPATEPPKNRQDFAKLMADLGPDGIVDTASQSGKFVVVNSPTPVVRMTVQIPAKVNNPPAKGPVAKGPVAKGPNNPAGNKVPMITKARPGLELSDAINEACLASDEMTVVVGGSFAGFTQTNLSEGPKGIVTGVQKYQAAEERAGVVSRRNP